MSKDYEFFVAEMEREAAKLRAWLNMMQASRQVEDSLRSLDLDARTDGCVTPLLREAMGNALTVLRWTAFEDFYRGYVEWTKSQPECRFVDSAEENARGMMWEALAQHGRTYEKLYNDLRTKKAA